VPGKGQKELGSFHSLELPYVFGTLQQPSWNWLPFGPADLKLGELMREYWTNFAKTGNPNGTGLPGWAAFDASTQIVMEFGADGRASSWPRSKPAFCDLDGSTLRNRFRARSQEESERK
jgi:para-nitrobenzyl esterase